MKLVISNLVIEFIFISNIKKQNLLAETKGNVQTVLFWNFSVEFSDC